MDTQYCLKVNEDVFDLANLIGEYILDQGDHDVFVFAHGKCISAKTGAVYTGTGEEPIRLVTVEAFRAVCTMLKDTETRLRREQEKKWWQKLLGK